MKIIISGYGKMGKELEKELKSHKLYIVSPETMTSFNDIKEQVDLIIDFSVPSVIHQIKKFIEKQHECSLIIGTTGYKENEESVIKDISNKHKVFKSSNFSKGMNIYFLLIDRLNSLDLTTSEISLIETHHVTKIDKPSGTALKISNKLNRDIKIESIRDKDNIGIHDLSLKFDDEEILIKHIAYSRKCFVNGVIDLIDKIDKFPIGLYLEEEIENGKRRNNQDD